MDADMRLMVLSFRIVELQRVLGLVGGNQRGLKAELQARVLDLVESNPPAPIQEKIRELFHTLRISKYGNAADLNPISGTPGNSGNTPLNRNVRMRMPPLKHAPMRNLNGVDGGGQAKHYPDVKMPPLKPAPMWNLNGVDGGGQAKHYPDVKMPPLKPAPMWNLIRVDGGGQAKHYPDVKMTETPFYDEVAVLIPVTSLPCQSESLQQEARYPIPLTLAQSQEVLSTGKKINVKTKTGLNVIKYQFSTQIQLRFVKLDSSKEQDEAFPPNLQVFVNGYAVQLPDFIMSNRPGVLPKRQSKPVDITSKVYGRGKPSILHVKWTEQSKEEPNFGILVRIARKLTPDELFGRLISKEIQPPEVTKEQIRKVTAIDDDDEEMCAPLCIPVSLACPLGGSRMSFPCRASTCEHVQCFDAKSFLMLNAVKPTFICPICKNRLKFGDLLIDGYLMDVIKKTPISAENLIEILPDGPWRRREGEKF